MFGLKEKLAGMIGLFGLVVMVHSGLKYYTTEQLLKHGQPLVGQVVGYRSYRTSKAPQHDKVELRVRYQGCQGSVEKALEAKRGDNLPGLGEVRLMSDGKCPETVVLRDAANTAWKEAIVGAILAIVGLIGVIAGLRKKG